MRCCWTDVSDCSVCEKLLNCAAGNELLRLQIENARLKAATAPKVQTDAVVSEPVKVSRQTGPKTIRKE